MNHLQPKTKAVLPIKPQTKLVVRFNRVNAQRVASNAPYRFVFEAVRTAVNEVDLELVAADVDNGRIVVKFKWAWFFSLKLPIEFYTAGLATLVDGVEAGRTGWFHAAREKRAARLLDHLCAAAFDADGLPGAAAYAEGLRPPAHVV